MATRTYAPSTAHRRQDRGPRPRQTTSHRPSLMPMFHPVAVAAPGDRQHTGRLTGIVSVGAPQTSGIQGARASRTILRLRTRLSLRSTRPRTLRHIMHSPDDTASHDITARPPSQMVSAFKGQSGLQGTMKQRQTPHDVRLHHNTNRFRPWDLYSPCLFRNHQERHCSLVHPIGPMIRESEVTRHPSRPSRRSFPQYCLALSLPIDTKAVHDRVERKKTMTTATTRRMAELRDARGTFLADLG
jgi:hypothetical protein